MSFLIYGAYGYTGALIAREAKRRGLSPILAGRNAEKLGALARELRLPRRAFPLSDQPALDEAVAAADAVLHCAGPFSRTAEPVLDACIRGGAHYLDITGEIEVFEWIAGQGPRARAEGVMLMPGVGFDVVATDCLAAHLVTRQPDAQYLELAISGVGRVSRGTALTAVENLGQGGAICRDGRPTRVPAAWRARQVDFGDGATTVISIPCSDVEAAWHTTGIPTVITYVELPRPAIRAMKVGRRVAPLLRLEPVHNLLKYLVEWAVEGPDEQMRRRRRSSVWAKAATGNGHAAKARFSGPGIYALTAQTALAAIRRVLDGDIAPGFQTPGSQFGPDFALEAEGTRREDLS